MTTVVNLSAAPRPAPATGETLLEVGDPALEDQDARDAGQVQSFCQQSANAMQRVDVVEAVEAAAACGAIGLKKAPALVHAQILDLHRDHLGGDRDRVDPSTPAGHVGSPEACVLRLISCACGLESR